MLATPTTAVETRIADAVREKHQRLLQRAAAMRLMVDVDYCRPDGCIVWSPDVRGRCAVVTADGCSCREYRLFGACPHLAAVTERHTSI